MDERQRGLREAVNRIVSGQKYFPGALVEAPDFRKLWPRGRAPRLPAAPRNSDHLEFGQLLW